MYKNAATIIRDQLKTRPHSESIARHTVAKSRISNLVAHAGKMLHYTEHALPGDVILPPLLTGKDAGEEEGNKPAPKIEVLARNRGLGLRRSASTGLDIYDPNAKKMVNKERIANIMQKVTDAVNDSTPDWEKRLDQKNKQLKRTQTQKKMDRYNNAHEMLVQLERKLKNAIMSAHQGVDSDAMEVRKNLTSRDLLPFYKMLDLKNFLDIYHRVDDDLSGDLNVDEWLQVFRCICCKLHSKNSSCIVMLYCVVSSIFFTSFCHHVFIRHPCNFLFIPLSSVLSSTLSFSPPSTSLLPSGRPDKCL